MSPTHHNPWGAKNPIVIIAQDTMVDRGFLYTNGVLPLPIHASAFERLLPPQFEPGNWDVICHNGKSNTSHSKFIVRLSYTKASSRSGKSAVITNIVASIRDCSDTGGGFVRFDPSLNQWYEVGDKVARDKVGQALRDILRSRKSTKDTMPRTSSAPVKSVQEGIIVSELEKKSNMSQVRKGFDTGALPAMVTVAEHSCSSPPRLMKSYSTVTLDSCSDSLVSRTCSSNFESRVDRCVTTSNTGTCTHDNTHMGCEDNVADWFEYEMTAR
eukprot:scaffold2408_cov94-Cylindrotheca_fusiformis.AAC.1